MLLTTDAGQGWEWQLGEGEPLGELVVAGD
jgi:hypothetical protein